MLTTILAFVVVIGVLIFVHELGHFLVAKAADIRVPRFSIGLGPKVLGFRRGETEYVISALPLGGYVRMAGMEELEPIEGGDPEADRHDGRTAVVSDAGLVGETEDPGGSRTFDSKSLPVRAAVISAGVAMNWAFAFLVFTAIALAWGIQRIPEARIAAVEAERLPAGTETLADVPIGARIVAVGDRRVNDWQDLQFAMVMAPAGPTMIRFADAPALTVQLPAEEEARGDLLRAIVPEMEVAVGVVESGGVAERAGLRRGDVIVAVDGRRVVTFPQFSQMIRDAPGRTVEIEVGRAGERLTIPLVPATVQDTATREAIGRIGVGGAAPRDPASLGGAVVHGVRETWRWTATIVRIVRDLVTLQVSPRQLGGPILIGQVSGETARLGLEAFLGFMAILSVNLAVLNLLPIPVLDGGQLLFLGIEAVRGRGLSMESRMRLTQVGFVLVMLLILLAVYNDVLRVFG